MSDFFKTDKLPFLIAGPCSAESAEQMDLVVSALAEFGAVKLVRCGVWKPRTQPGNFEGRGEESLRWIADLRQRYHVRFATEVATPEHVELCLKYGLDAFWIGSRTVCNPFSVSELCEALKGTDIPVMVKNPLIPDVKLWAGALERVENAGIADVAAIHRGFFLHNNYDFRNNPLWEIPIELKRIKPSLPVFCDPSHICGKRSLVASLSQTALDLNFDGLMIETHHDPEMALTDGNQQVTPDELREIWKALRVPQNDSNIPEELLLLRKQIDLLDDELLNILSQRSDVSRKIAEIKLHNNLPILQLDRWKNLLQDHLSEAEKKHLSPEFIRKIFETIHSESVRLQDEIFSK